jgi:hypothetical protein
LSEDFVGSEVVAPRSLAEVSPQSAAEEIKDKSAGRLSLKMSTSEGEFGVDRMM